ncbi:MAG TPA: ABC transporter ATP-binding protein [Bacillota bacterium]|nr:ABC transporter ATP-binding protein [Bacillota bacterium]HPU95258.1 ABC transporter ATP-binding protein [Bacillota bacterium]
MKVRMERICYSYGAKAALTEVTASVPSGSLTGIIGPNGSGKSTLLRILGHVVRPASGRVLYDGADISSMPPMGRARLIGAVLQDPGAQFAFTVGDVVEMGRFPYNGLLGRSGRRDAEAVCDAMRMAGVRDLKGRQITALSSGERQRVFIARALAQEPKVMLLDEPTSHLDISYQLEIMEILKGLASSGTTVIIVMHDLNLAGLYCDRLIALKEGRVVSEGLPDDVLTADNILEIYGVRAVVKNNPETSRPGIVMLTPSSKP